MKTYLFEIPAHVEFSVTASSEAEALERAIEFRDSTSWNGEPLMDSRYGQEATSGGWAAWVNDTGEIELRDEVSS